ncbi:hypothetical protein ASD64_19100 [Mesorhizobium sp. Root157]|uniref:hypothetical protein n=1 Tax=Mesorhizobium sp. Root157 TaxID=1736477 RepID=UPI0006FB81DE|nr:hypothetical protein [Mesorhizobium sp. Root157]KQZ93239.1 hypothetical protein ASD64_19100 [Mesorhizobium sp. Root157]
MHQELYADGIGEVTVSGTIVRIDLVSLSPTERDQSNSPKPAFRQRVIMPVESFANSVELMQKVLQGLIEAGAIKRTPVPTAQEGEKHGRGDVRLNGSPNFS